MRKLLIVAVVLLVGVSQAQAAFHWEFENSVELTPSAGDTLEIKYRNYETLVDDLTIDTELYGVAYITDIYNVTTGKTIWIDRTTDGGEITGIFNNYLLKNSTVATSGDVTLYFEGGNLDFYYDSTADSYDNVTGQSYNWRANPTEGNNSNPDNDGGVWTNGTPWISLTGAGNVVADDTTTTYNESNATLRAKLEALTGFQTDSDGKGLFDVDTSVAAQMTTVFDSDIGWLLNPTADMRLETSLVDITGDSNYLAGAYPVRSNDPIMSKYVPEPASVMIWVVLGISMVLLRKRS